MGYSQSTRRELGEKFSEAARQLWLVFEGSKVTRAAFAESLEISRGALHKLLYGDTQPDRDTAVRIHAAFPAIDPALWDVQPRKRFVLPAARSAA